MWIGKAIAHHNLIYENFLLPPRLKGGLILMLFEKVSNLSQFTVNSQETGKITNMLSNDFNSVSSFCFFTITFSIPIKLITISVLLYLRLGWMFIILHCVIGLTVLFQIGLGKLTSKYFKEINIPKDKRIKLYTELLEGIKLIKLYGW